MLWEIAKQLGYEKQQAVRILRNNGVEGEFSLDQFDHYVEILTKSAGLGEKIREKVSHTPSPAVDFERCPICGGEIEWKDEADAYWRRIPKEDRWRCKAGVGHWFSWRYGAVAKKDMEMRRRWYERISGGAEVYPGGGGVRGDKPSEPPEVDGSGI